MLEAFCARHCVPSKLMAGARCLSACRLLSDHLYTLYVMLECSKLNSYSARGLAQAACVGASWAQLRRSCPASAPRLGNALISHPQILRPYTRCCWCSDAEGWKANLRASRMCRPAPFSVNSLQAASVSSPVPPCHFYRTISQALPLSLVPFHCPLRESRAGSSVSSLLPWQGSSCALAAAGSQRPGIRLTHHLSNCPLYVLSSTSPSMPSSLAPRTARHCRPLKRCKASRGCGHNPAARATHSRRASVAVSPV